jgi:hypothetical protein
MIGNEVDNHFHPFCMDAADQLLKVDHRAQIGVNGMVIRDSVWRTGAAFGNVGVRACAFGSMFQDAGQPNMGNAHVFDGVKGGSIDVIEGATTILGLAAIQPKSGLLVAEKSREKLVNVHTAKI